MLGQGHFGKVYKGTYQGKPAAIKTLVVGPSTQAYKIESFQWEGSRLRGLSHPHVIELYAMQQVGDELQLVLEFCNGGDLQDAIEKKSRSMQQLEVQWRLLVQLASALVSL